LIDTRSSDNAEEDDKEEEQSMGGIETTHSGVNSERQVVPEPTALALSF
jgi:hypothetical protein